MEQEGFVDTLVITAQGLLDMFLLRTRSVHGVLVQVSFVGNRATTVADPVDILH